ncbi:hypothetical protein M405DRAFT_870183 [Rhizopogon salebrosus TDB-379]|nr:hypothetical protein M405DRAFT_870183 [Rhizopogon salebrosus TDB-379]
MSKPNTRSGSKSNDSAAPASSTHPPSTKAVVPPRPKPCPSSKASSKVFVGRKRKEEDVVDGGDGGDDRAALTAKIALLKHQLKGNANFKAKAAQERLETERQALLKHQLKGNANFKAKAAQERLETERQASRKRTQDMLDAESNAEEDAEDLDAPLLLTEKARQSAVGLDDDDDELARLMQDDLDDAEHQDEEDACKAHTMDDMLIEGDKDDTPPPCTQPCSKDLSISSIVASSRSSTPLSELGALSKKERGYLHNLPDKAGIIAAMGHRMLCIHVATVDGFPSTTSKEDGGMGRTAET